jgi:hypothetical protein
MRYCAGKMEVWIQAVSLLMFRHVLKTAGGEVAGIYLLATLARANQSK